MSSARKYLKWMLTGRSSEMLEDRSIGLGRQAQGAVVLQEIAAVLLAVRGITSDVIVQLTREKLLEHLAVVREVLLLRVPVHL